MSAKCASVTPYALNPGTPRRCTQTRTDTLAGLCNQNHRQINAVTRTLHKFSIQVAASSAIALALPVTIVANSLGKTNTDMQEQQARDQRNGQLYLKRSRYSESGARAARARMFTRMTAATTRDTMEGNERGTGKRREGYLQEWRHRQHREAPRGTFLQSAQQTRAQRLTSHWQAPNLHTATLHTCLPARSHWFHPRQRPVTQCQRTHRETQTMGKPRKVASRGSPQTRT
jgi:hypothetical protein